MLKKTAITNAIKKPTYEYVINGNEIKVQPYNPVKGWFNLVNIYIIIN